MTTVQQIQIQNHRALKNIFAVVLLLAVAKFSFSQCACVHNDNNGNLVCTIYSDCGNPNFQACRTRVSTPPLYAVAPATPTQNCPTVSGCSPYGYNTAYDGPGGNTNGGACWYQGGGCSASLVCQIVALPVTLISFQGNIQNGENIMEWVTASEWNSDYFILLMSNDGINYVNVAVISAAGNSTDNKNYRVNHVDPKPLINYYKLIQVDFDGQMAEYGPISIDNRDHKFVGLFSDFYPNPSDQNMYFQYGGSDFLNPVVVEVLNAVGERIMLYEVSEFNRYQGIPLDASTLPSGLYTARIRQGDEFETKKIVIAH
jgi:hypothetical protein